MSYVCDLYSQQTAGDTELLPLQLKGYETFFDPTELLFMKCEGLFRETIACYVEVLRFLSLEAIMPGGP